MSKKPTPPNPLPCGCAVMGKRDLDMIGPDCAINIRYTGMHVAHCPLHGAAPKLLAACEAFEAAHRGDMSIGEAARMIRAAIAEVRGTK